ncbi:MAG TPA: hypothetical protein VIF09_12295, partial [Polyangiaceae bacterium]
GKLVRAADGVETTVDVGASGSALFDPSGATVFYVAGGALKHAAVPVPTPSTLVASGCTEVRALSPDGAQLVFAKGADLYLLPLTTQGPPSQVWSGAQGTAAHVSFTIDSTYLLVGAPGELAYPGYKAIPVRGGAPVAFAASAQAVVPLHAASVLLYDLGGALRIVDLSGQNADREVWAHASGFAVSKDRRKLVYVADKTGAPGLYVVLT